MEMTVPPLRASAPMPTGHHVHDFADQELSFSVSGLASCELRRRGDWI
jgi:hypothetical protein